MNYVFERFSEFSKYPENSTPLSSLQDSGVHELIVLCSSNAFRNIAKDFPSLHLMFNTLSCPKVFFTSANLFVCFLFSCFCGHVHLPLKTSLPQIEKIYLTFTAQAPRLHFCQICSWFHLYAGWGGELAKTEALLILLQSLAYIFREPSSFIPGSFEGGWNTVKSPLFKEQSDKRFIKDIVFRITLSMCFCPEHFRITAP